MSPQPPSQQPQPPNPSGEPTEQEAGEFMNQLKSQAEAWRTKLSDPQVAAQVKAGTLRVSPLVTELLAMFPPASPK